ncbi:MAG: hypothetical protein EOP48_19425 [Sphingobacteriales bacterium]|nr:MAG: hypothetical protein EOP48_19425 [Sphingobacteriales bacterium]
MNRQQIAKKINSSYPDIYAVTDHPAKLIFKDGTIKVGFFQHTSKSLKLAEQDIYTFIEFGERAQNFRATQNEKYVTEVNIAEVEDVEYPALADAISNKLERYQKAQLVRDEIDWEKYSKKWVEDINSLYALIMYNWLNQYSEKKLIEFSVLPVMRDDPYAGKYITAILEIAFINRQTMILEPVSSVTSEYDGNLDLYMRGFVYRKANLLRKLDENGGHHWVLAFSSHQKDHYPLNRNQFEGVLNQWLI